MFLYQTGHIWVTTIFYCFHCQMYGNCCAQILLQLNFVPFCHHRCCLKPFKWMLSHEMHSRNSQSRTRLASLAQTPIAADTERNRLLFILTDKYHCSLLWSLQVHFSNKILCIFYNWKFSKFIMNASNVLGSDFIYLCQLLCSSFNLFWHTFGVTTEHFQCNFFIRFAKRFTAIMQITLTLLLFVYLYLIRFQLCAIWFFYLESFEVIVEAI